MRGDRLSSPVIALFDRRLDRRAEHQTPANEDERERALYAFRSVVRPLADELGSTR